MMTRTTTRCRAILAGAGLGLLLTTPAMAGLPKVLDHIPADASAVLVIDDLGQLDKHFNQFVGAIEMPSMVTPSQALNQLGIGANLNMSGSAALVVLSYDIDAEYGEFIFLAPTRDYDALVGAFEPADGGGGGISAFSVENDTVYAKQIGAWAAMSTERDTVERFTGEAGNLRAFENRFGASGLEMAEASDIFISINPANMAPVIERMKEEFENNSNKFAGGQDVTQQMEMMTKVMDGFVRDGSSAGFGVRFGPMGIAGTGSIGFKPGTEGAKLFTLGGDSSALLGKLPAGSFLFAGAMDNTAPFALAMMEWAKTSGIMEMNQAMGMGAFNMDGLYEHMSGAAGAVYPNPAGLMGGLFANSVAFTASKDPAKLRAAMKDKFGEMNMDNQDLGMAITSSYTASETTIAGKDADGYAISINMGGMDPGAMMFNPMQMIFGSPNGPTGYLVEANGGVYQSYSRSSTMLAPAVEGGSALTEDGALAKVADNLPEGRYMEFYIGIRPIIDQAMPFLGMMGIPLPDLSGQMPPIGLGVASRDAGVVSGLFIPAPTIKSALQIAQSMEGLAGGDAAEGDEGPGF